MSEGAEESKQVRETTSATVSRDQIGRTKINQYTIVRKLGEGSFAKVKLAEYAGQPYAIKIFKKSVLLKKRDFITDEEGNMVMHNALQDVQKEVAVMKKLTHCNVVKLHEVIDDDRNDRMYLVIDYCAKGPILDWDEDEEAFVTSDHRKYDETEIRRMFRDMVCGLEFLHSNKIMHQDIKPQNILVTETGQVKLADFGQARVIGECDMTAQSFGTYFFFAPEACNSEGLAHSSKASDIWALGLCLYAMAYNRLPFSADCLSDIFEQITTFCLSFPEEPEMSDNFKLLIDRMLVKNPKQRIKMHELIQNAWVNHDASPLQRSNSRPIEVTQEEISNAIVPLRTIMLMKTKSRRWLIDAKKSLQTRNTL
jgi:[calcium/calmodulin-dependent protein kinase] kinase